MWSPLIRGERLTGLHISGESAHRLRAAGRRPAIAGGGQGRREPTLTTDTQITSRGGPAAGPASSRPRRRAWRPPRRLMPEPTSTVILSRFGPLIGDTNSSAGDDLPSSRYVCTSLTRAGTSAGSLQELIDERAGDGVHRGLDLAALRRVDEGDELLGRLQLGAFGGLRDVERVRQPDGQPVLAASWAGSGEEADVVDIVLDVLVDRRDGAGQHRVVRGRPGGDRLDVRRRTWPRRSSC